MQLSAVGWVSASLLVLLCIGLSIGLRGKLLGHQAESREVATATLPDDRPATAAQTAMAPEVPADWPDRVAEARQKFALKMQTDFQAAGLAYPPRAIYLRVFKHEAELELWALPNDGNGDPGNAFRHVRTFPILCASGRLGPKRREGDKQVPEGFYTIDRFNPRSRFHLSLGLDYPNASDRLLAVDPQQPGSDIFIHGGAESIGCVALGDDAVAQLYLVALDVGTPDAREAIPVHIFPCRMTPENWRTVLAPRSVASPELGAFWRGLQPAFDAFEHEMRPPNVQVRVDGSYALESH